MQNLDPGARSEDVLTPISKDFKEAKMCGSGGKANVFIKSIADCL